MGFGTAPLLIIAFCLLMVIAASIVLIRSKWLIQWLTGSAGLLLIALAVYFSWFSLNLFSYKPLSHETPLVTVSFRTLAPQSFVATLSQTGYDSVDYQIDGDLWRLDARVIRWKGAFALLGLQPGYQLDRIQGRYLTLEDERSKEPSEYQISRPAIGFDVWQNARTGWSMMIKADYGMGSVMPMADGAIYEVTLGNTGLVTRPLNGAAQDALKRWE